MCGHSTMNPPEDSDIWSSGRTALISPPAFGHSKSAAPYLVLWRWKPMLTIQISAFKGKPHRAQSFRLPFDLWTLFVYIPKKTQWVDGFQRGFTETHLLEPSNELFRCYGSTSVSVSPSKPTGLFVWNSIGLGNQKKSPEVILQLPRGFVDLDFWDFGWKTKTRLSWLWCLCVMCSRVNPRCCDSHPWFRRDSLPPPLWCQEDLEVSKLVKQPFKRLVLKH